MLFKKGRKTMTGYSDEYTKHLAKYDIAIKEVDRIITSKTYMDMFGNDSSKYALKLEFLRASQTAEMLETFHNDCKGEGRFNFNTVNDAIAIYRSVVDVRKNTPALLEKATFVMNYETAVDYVNSIVHESPFLPNSLLLVSDDKIAVLARTCLEKLPECKNLINKDFKRGIVESCLSQFAVEDIEKLVSEGVIKPADMSIISLVGNDNYNDNIVYLRSKFGLSDLIVESHNIRVAGTSHSNEDGVSRQDLLGKLKVSENKDLSCNKTTWKPNEIGEEKNAVEIVWNGSIIGYVPQSVVDEIFGKYEEPDFKASVLDVSGGGKVNYGCNVKLDIVAKELIKTEEIER